MPKPKQSFGSVSGVFRLLRFVLPQTYVCFTVKPHAQATSMPLTIMLPGTHSASTQPAGSMSDGTSNRAMEAGDITGYCDAADRFVFAFILFNPSLNAHGGSHTIT